jgi:hypothetical protein
MSNASVGLSGLESRHVPGRVGLAGFAQEHQLPIAHADFVARVEARRLLDFPPVQECAILGGHVVKFAGKVGMHQDGTMAA